MFGKPNKGLLISEVTWGDLNWNDVQQNVQQFSATSVKLDLLTRRNGTWHFVRRVPIAFAHLDPRGVVRHSTKIRVAHDRTGRRAALVAARLNDQLELSWKGMLDGQSDVALSRYQNARQQAQAMGFEYLESAKLLEQPVEAILQRLEALVGKGVSEDAPTRAALLGTEKPPSFRLSGLFEEYEKATRDERRDFSRDQLRIWRAERLRALEGFLAVAGDKPVNEITANDALDYCDWWRQRILKGETVVKTANKHIGQLSRMLKDMSRRRRLNLPDAFQGLRLRGEVEKSRSSYETDFIQNRLLARGALDGLNEDARLVLYIIADTGLRISEVVNLTRNAIRLEAPIPHIKVLPEGRRLKTTDSERDIPLVGAALAAMRLRPDGFPRYRDKGTSLSATVNKFMGEHGLRPTQEHSVYSLRHSFKDRLIAAEAPDSLIDSLMGHRTYKPKYGKGPSLELKLKFLERIAFRAP